MQDRRELIKAIVEAVGPLIDARIKTAEVIIKANTDAAIKAAKDELRSEMATPKIIREEVEAEGKRTRQGVTVEIKLLEGQFHSNLSEVKERLKNVEISNASIERKIDKKLEDHDTRISQLEEPAEFPHSH